MMKAHNIRVRAFSPSAEVEDTRKSLLKILPEDARIEVQQLEAELDGGVFKEPLTVLTSLMDKESMMSEFLKMLRETLDAEDLNQLRQTLDQRVDGSCNFYIRLSKASAAERRFKLEDEDAIHVKIKAKCFPADREKAIEMIREWLV
ncbi:MAG: RNA-binding domain-containing protein [Candidatus Altiarchaeota archaeon]